MNFSAVILAGGKSSRMGRDKAFLEIAGETLLARQMALVCEINATEIFISGRDGVNYSAFGCRVLKDKFPNAGPLAGIESALDSISTSLLLVLAVDLPAMSAIFLRQLLSKCEEDTGVIPRADGQIEPLVAFYPKVARLLAENSLRERNNSVALFAEHCVRSNLARFTECVADEQKLFANWNSPADICAVPRN